MTPYELHIENQAFEMKFKRNNIINLELLNAVTGFMGGSRLDFDEILGYKTLKDYNLKSIDSFMKDGKIDFERWEEYLENVVKPVKRKLGLEV